METLLAFVVGVLYATGVYLLLHRSLVQVVFGLALLAHGANLLIFTSAGLTRAAPPIIAPGATSFPALPADPLPQALILTAIVIGFGVMSFVLVLVRRAHQVLSTDDSDRLVVEDS